MRYLIVGGAGYFGSRLAEALQGEAEVTVTRRSDSPIKEDWIKRRGLWGVRFDSAVSDTIAVEGRFDAIINLAMPGAAEATRDPEAAREQALSTVRACVRLLDAGQAARLLHFSSFHVYGTGGRSSYDEADEPAPIHPYGHAHLACEKYLANDERAWIVRPSNMVGTPAHADLGDQAKLLFVDLCLQAAAGVMKLQNDGLSYRDFLPFSDAIAAARLLLRASPQKERLFNLAHGESLRLDEAARLIQRSASVPPTLEFGNGQDAFRQPFNVRTNRLKNLGWQPAASLEDEASHMVKFFA